MGYRKRIQQRRRTLGATTGQQFEPCQVAITKPKPREVRTSAVRLVKQLAQRQGCKLKLWSKGCVRVEAPRAADCAAIPHRSPIVVCDQFAKQLQAERRGQLGPARLLQGRTEVLHVD